MTNVDAWIFSPDTQTVGDYFLMGPNITEAFDPIQNLENVKVIRDEEAYMWEF